MVGGSARALEGPPATQTSTFDGFRVFFPEALRRVLLLKAAANFTCQLLMPTCRELLHLPTSHANLSRVTSPANLAPCEFVLSPMNPLRGSCVSKRSRCGAVRIPTFREILYLPTSRGNFSKNHFTCQLLVPPFREVLHLPTSPANFSRVTSPANFSRQLFENYFACQLLMLTFRKLLHLPASHANFSRVTSPANFSCQLFESYFTCQLLMPTFLLSYFACQLLMSTLRELLHPPTLPDV